jgi:hypothetical protein
MLFPTVLRLPPASRIIVGIFFGSLFWGGVVRISIDKGHSHSQVMQDWKRNSDKELHIMNNEYV